jgi:hypothetical protein
MVKGFKKCCISDEMDGREDEEEVGNAGSECESENSEYETRWEL